MILIILKSLLLGLFFTLPLGPIGVLCIRKILQFGRLYGFILGLSQVFVIFAYSIIAILSLNWLSDLIMNYQFWIRLVGGLVLIGFGIQIFFSKSSAITKKDVSKKRFIADFFSIAGLMLVSPHTILVFLAFFAVLDFYKAATFIQHIEVIFGILIGSIFSWALVCVCFAGYKTKTTLKAMTWINRSVGISLFGFGIVACISAILLAP
jgi:threonine/homoserine/homoserine lactone efflux protein